MKLASPEQLLVVSVLLAILPLMVVTATCYLKCSIVLSLLRSGFGSQQAPSNSLIMALSLVLSLVVMEPIGREVWKEVAGWRVDQTSKLPVSAVVVRGAQALEPWRQFLVKNCGERELAVMTHESSSQELATDGSERAKTEPGPIQVLAAFVLSEIRRGFLMAFAMLVPFFVIDVVVANVLVGLGLTMMSPVVVSLPLKLLLFVSCDGWLQVARGVMSSYA